MDPDTVRLTPTCRVSFAAPGRARSLLAARDEFIARLSPYDRAARMRTPREVSEGEFVAFVAGCARAWDTPEIEMVTRALESAAPKLAPFALPFPPEVVMVTTTGAEEGNSAYTRGNFIVLPPKKLAYPRAEDFETLLIHELFHVLTRHNPELRRALYATIGYRPCGEVPLPPALATRRITNPDAPRDDYCIDVTCDGARLAVVPILLAPAATYDPAQGGEHYRHVQFKLLGVAEDGGGRQPILRDGVPLLLEAGQVSGLVEQAGRNTRPGNQPEEILAENFTHLITGTPGLPSPEVVERVRGVLVRV